MTTISILGTGNMGTAIAGVVRQAGHTAELLGSADVHKPVTGDIVVLAVPFGAVTELLAQRASQLEGKVVVDITNPVDFTTFDSLTVASDASATAEIAAALPHSHVLKAFNTNFAATLTSRTLAGQPTTVLIAGDDADAKARLGAIVDAAGLRAIDAGTLRRARELEAVGFLQMTLGAAERISWAGGFAVAA